MDWRYEQVGKARHIVTGGKRYKLAGAMINKNLVEIETMHPKVYFSSVVNIFGGFHLFRHS